MSNSTQEFPEVGSGGDSLNVAHRTKGPKKTVARQRPDLPKITDRRVIFPHSYDAIVRATYNQNKELAEYIRGRLTVVVGDITCLSPSPHLIRKKLKRIGKPK